MSTARKLATSPFSVARYNMVDCQLRPNKVRDERILSTMEELPREAFVPQLMKGIAYIDKDLEVAPGRFLLEPMILARLIEAVAVTSRDRVLDIATATGYSTAVLATLARKVVAIEPDITLQKLAADTLKSLGIMNAEVQIASMSQGLPTSGPYDVIFINGSVDAVPKALLDQLEEGGRLVAVVRHYGPARTAHTGEARLYEKIHGTTSSRALFDANVKPLAAFEAPQAFVF